MRRRLALMPYKIASWLGVCVWLAYHLGFSTIIIRILFLVFTFAVSGSGLIIYLILWLCMDEWDEIPEDYHEVTGS